MNRAKLPPFSERLLGWWDQHGRKNLPWQHPRTPYRVWVSEIMLQQTQVSTVIPYFLRWMESFPDIARLATASGDEVLNHWAGLGYYARARNLHKSARLCMEHHAGQLPEAAEDLTGLAGIGESTANAIISQSWDTPAAVLDGNVKRTLARHAAIEGWPGKSAVLRQLWHEARQRLPDSRGADYTQAIMDLGATVCTRSQPDCTQCPVQRDCKALQQDQVNTLPSPKPAAKVTDRAYTLTLYRDAAGRVLLEKRPPTGIWGGLWCPPLEEVNPPANQISEGLPLQAISHRLSHIRMSIQPVLVSAAEGSGVECPANSDWFSKKEIRKLGLPRPVFVLLNQLNDGEIR